MSDALVDAAYAWLCAWRNGVFSPQRCVASAVEVDADAAEAADASALAVVRDLSASETAASDVTWQRDRAIELWAAQNALVLKALAPAQGAVASRSLNAGGILIGQTLS